MVFNVATAQFAVAILPRKLRKIHQWAPARHPFTTTPSTPPSDPGASQAHIATRLGVLFSAIPQSFLAICFPQFFFAFFPRFSQFSAIFRIFPQFSLFSRNFSHFFQFSHFFSAIFFAVIRNFPATLPFKIFPPQPPTPIPCPPAQVLQQHPPGPGPGYAINMHRHNVTGCCAAALATLFQAVWPRRGQEPNGGWVPPASTFVGTPVWGWNICLGAI